MSVTKVSNPVISGTAKVGQVLTTSDGVWTTTSDYLTYEYQWMRVNAAGQSPIDIAGATSKNYTVQTSDLGYRLKVRVTPKEHDNAPDPEPPPGGATGTKLRWAPPALSNPTTKTISNSSRAIGNGNDGDVKVVTADRLLGGVGEIKSWNDLVAIAGEMFSNEANEGHIIPRENTGVFHLEGWRIVLSNAADAITCRWRQPTLQIQNCYIEVTTAGTSHHSDGFQTQEAIINELRFDRCTIKTDYQGIFMSNEPQNAGPERSRVSHQIFSRVLFLPGVRGAPATYWFKAFPPRPNADPIGPTEMYDVWMPAANAGYKVYPQQSFASWAGGTQKYGCFVTTKVHPSNGKTYGFVRFSKSSDTVPTGSFAGQAAGDCQVGGDGGVWLYNSLSEVPSYVGCDASVGRGYVSPGYL